MTIISLNADLVVPATGGVATLDPLGLIIRHFRFRHPAYSPTWLSTSTVKGTGYFLGEAMIFPRNQVRQN